MMKGAAMLVDDFLAQSATLRPEKTACVCDGKRLTYGEVNDEANRLAHALLDSGLQRGDRVAIFLPNGSEAVVSVFGVLRAGGAFVMVNPSTKQEKLAYVLNDCGATKMISAGRPAPDAPGGAFAAQCAPVKDGMAAAGPTFDLGPGLRGYPAGAPPRMCIDIDLAAIIYTSGSTGRPKGVAVSHLNMISAANSVVEYLENVQDDVILNVLPMSFGYGLYQVLMAAKVGGTVVLEQSFAFPYRVVQHIEEEGVTGVPGVPTVFAILLQLRDLKPGSFDSVRYVTNAGAALPPAHIPRLQQLFRKARIYSMYGITECKRVSYLPPDQLAVRPASVGRGMPNQDVFVVDASGNPVAPGEVGELVVRGSHVMMGYWNQPELTGRVLRPGRYPWERVLYTGDLFTVDAEGYLYFVSRKDDIIKSRGEKVSPCEVELAIYELPDVQEAAVIGVPDAVLGEAVKAVVVPAEGAELTETDILRQCARRLENFAVPSVVEFRTSLPRTSSGKISRSALRAEHERKEG